MSRFEFDRWGIRGLVRWLARQFAQLPVARSTWLVTSLTFALGFLPILSRPGYESALVFGLLIPPITAVSTAISTRVGGTVEERLFVALRRAVAHASALTLLLSMHAARGGWCAPGHDLTMILLGPVAGIVMAAFWGSAAGLATQHVDATHRSRWAAPGLAIAGPLTTIALGLVEFYRSPVVFAFDPFVGFFAGSPYDTGFDPTARLLTYRAGSLGLWILLWALARHLTVDSVGKLSVTRWFVRQGAAGTGAHFRWNVAADGAAALLGLIGLGLCVTIMALGEPLGHRSSTALIRRTLGQVTQVGRCEIVYGAAQKRRQVQRLAGDCNAWLTRLERRLGTGRLERVSVYVFDNVSQKEILMGAARTQIAKPWRREIYLNGADYPDDVVGHELAHVVGGLVAGGPFKIAGSLGGWLPNPGLIEGLAVALAPDEDGELTELEWSAALDRIGKLPDVVPLFSLNFLGHSGPLAYTVAGAFVDWVGKQYGKRAVRRWYAGASLESATSSTVEALEQAFRIRLGRVRLPETALEAARSRFARPGVYSRQCPHAVDRALSDADQYLAAGDPVQACHLYRQAQRLDASEIRARFGLGECASRAATDLQQAAPALRAFRAIAEDRTLPVPLQQRALEKQADLELRFGNVASSRAIYEKLLGQTFDVDRRRNLELRLAAKTDTAIGAVQALLTGIDGENTWDLAVRELLRWSEESPKDGLADYLLGRNFWQKGRESAGVEHLDIALERGLQLPQFRVEALRLRIAMACALGDRSRATELANRIVHELELPTPRRLGALRLVERCAGRLVGDDWPELRAAELAGAAPGTLASTASGAVAAANSANSATLASVVGDPSERAPRAEAPVRTTHQPHAYDSDAFECPQGMQKITGGQFWVGSKRGTHGADESPRFSTRLRGFCLDRTEVTLDAYGECVRRDECSPALGKSHSCNARHEDRGNHPINCVTHVQAVAYCSSQGARLPSEVEWEYAARGGAQELKYPWGEGSPDGRACWKNRQSCSVASYAPGVYGLYDMSGNVWEWTSSKYGEYPWGTPFAGDVTAMVYRGGSWSRRFEKWMHVGLRNRLAPREQGAHLGFRCAKDAEGLTCPFETQPDGSCAIGVLDAECPPGQLWNGHRCAKPGDPACPEGYHIESGQGCLRDLPIIVKHTSLALEQVRVQRSPEFDADCRLNQPNRPNAFRYSGGSHEARNVAARQVGCKNRDVGVGWNSSCCP